MRIIAPDNIKEFLENRVKALTDKIGDVVFEVRDCDPRSINFSSDLSMFTISASDINDLDNYFNRMGLLQAFYRFVGFHAMSLGIFLLHGSSSVYNGKVIVFGDNGELNKTLSSVELGLNSRMYLADEFVFWDSNSREIFSDKDTPIHLRGEVRSHLDRFHHIKNLTEFVSGDFLGFEWQNHKSLDLVCYTKFTKDQEKVVALDRLRAVNYAKITLSAHINKLLNPKLDRFQFITMSDDISRDDKVVEMKMNHYFEKYQKIAPILDRAAEQLVECVPSVEIFTDNPCRIPNLIASIL